MSLGSLHRDRAFLIGALLKCLLILSVWPLIQGDWFVPFLTHAISQPSLDPWSDFLADGGSALAFPYGPAMLLVFLPLTALGAALHHVTGIAGLDAGLGFRLTLLLADFCTLWLVVRLAAPTRQKSLLISYWLSPLAFFVTYWHGQLDIVPVAIALAGLCAIRDRKPRLAGLWLALAVSAKLAMALIGPFVVIYLWQNRRLRDMLAPFVLAGALTGAAMLLPWALFSPGFQAIVLGTPEAKKLWFLSLAMGENEVLYLVPAAYFFMLYTAWRLRRSNFELLMAMAGVSFFLVVLATPASPGWYLWVLPFLALYQARSDRMAAGLTWVFNISVLSKLFLVSSGARLAIPGLPFDGFAPMAMSGHVVSLWNTAIIVAGAVLLMRMYRDSVHGNDFYRLSRQSLAIGIAGDSGSGKDTLARSLEGLFGSASVSSVHGDAYHRWERGAPMWRSLTHLDPRANDLQRFSRDSCDILDGQTVWCRHYDHRTGHFTLPTPVKPNEIVIITGLHSLLPLNLVERLDVKIFLDPDDELRLHWKLMRDMESRNQNREALEKSMQARRADSETFIRPQATKADLVFSLSKANPSYHASDHEIVNPPLKLHIILRNCLFAEKLVRVLVGLCGLQVDFDIFDGGRAIEMSIDGDVTGEDIQLAAAMLDLNLDELLDINPQWASHEAGIIQLVVLLQIDQTLRKRAP